jgi:hypothetical protein
MNIKKSGLYAKISSNIKFFVKTKDRVLMKFLVDMIKGMLISMSVNVSAIARAIEKDHTAKVRHIFKRLDRNLGDLDTSKVKEVVQLKAARGVDDSTIIYFDPTDITKPCGKKFEALSKVADGSDNHKIKPGYPVTACIGLKGDDIIPLEFNPYSYNSEDFVSRNAKEYEQIDSIIIRSNSKGTHVFDRGFDSFSTVRHLQHMNVNFIIRMSSDRKYRLISMCRSTFDRDEIINNYREYKYKTFIDIKYEKKLIKAPCIIEGARVELLGGHIDSVRSLKLIRSIIRISRRKRLVLYLLTNIEPINFDTLTNIVQAYINRWKIEEFIRFTKQQYGLEKIKVLSLGRIYNMANILYIALVILTRTAELNILWSKTRATLIKYAKRTYKIPQKLRFYLYMIADGLSEIMRAMTKRVCQIVYKKSKMQMEIAFMKEYDVNF